MTNPQLFNVMPQLTKVDKVKSNQLFRAASMNKLASPEQLDSLLRVTSSRSWIWLSGLGGVILTILFWGFFGNIPTTVTANGLLVSSPNTPKSFQVVALVPLAEGKRLQPGMSAQIIFSNAGKQTASHLIGKISYISDAPVTATELVSTVGNSFIAQSLTTSGLFLQVNIELEPDNNTTVGYKWSSGANPNIRLSNFTPLAVRFVLAEQRPLDLALPVWR
jgi:hypothetical protein